jgi:hypothetical protein
MNQDDSLSGRGVFDGSAPDRLLGVCHTLRTRRRRLQRTARIGLLPGTLADLALLDRDRFRLATPALGEARVRAAEVGGRVGYRRERSAAAGVALAETAHAATELGKRQHSP